jgi:hypothetical protein
VPLRRRHRTPLQQGLNALARAERARSVSSLTNALIALGSVRQHPVSHPVHQLDVVDQDHDDGLATRPRPMSVLGSSIKT